jgi:hypothetical protein
MKVMKRQLGVGFSQPKHEGIQGKMMCFLVAPLSSGEQLTELCGLSPILFIHTPKNQLTILLQVIVTIINASESMNVVMCGFSVKQYETNRKPQHAGDKKTSGI